MSTTVTPGPLPSAPRGGQGVLSDDPARDHSLRRAKGRYGERLAHGALAGSAGLTVAGTIGIFVALLLPALGFFQQISVSDFLFGSRWAPTFADASFGVLPLLTGTFWTTLIGLLLAVPFGLGAAIYLSEYAGSRTRRVLKPVLELLAGIPSVVYGYFALYFVAPQVLEGALGLQLGTFSVLAAGLVLGVMIIPTVASLSEDAMSAVPQALRQGSYALGANKMRTVLRSLSQPGRDSVSLTPPASRPHGALSKLSLRAHHAMIHIPKILKSR
jgi:ABC-type phosphate transport system permease subunit